MEPHEIEFLAVKERIQVEPHFSVDPLCLIEGDVGPFLANVPVDIPLWLAIDLKQKQQCRIFPPEWMTLETLEEKKQEEINSALCTKPLSPHYLEITHSLLCHAADDIPQGDVIRTLVKDIWDLRMAKLRTSINSFVGSRATRARVNNLTQMELNNVRGLLTASLGVLTHLQRSKDEAEQRQTERAADRASQNSTFNSTITPR